MHFIEEMLLSYPPKPPDMTTCAAAPAPLGSYTERSWFTSLKCSKKHFFCILFCLETQTEGGRAVSQHKHLCKHVTKTGHVLLVCFTDSLHFLLQVLPGASIKTAGSWKRTTPLCVKVCTYKVKLCCLFIINNWLLWLPQHNTVTSRKTSTHKIHSDQHSRLHSKLRQETPSCFSHS